MKRVLTFTCFAIVVLLGSAVQGQAQFSLRAASADPVANWQELKVPDQTRTVWVAPTASLTSVDVDRAEPGTTSDGSRTVKVVFTDAGAKKMRDLCAAQMNKLIALMLDEKLIWAPVVRSEIGKEAVITGGPNGLTESEVKRLITSIGKK